MTLRPRIFAMAAMLALAGFGLASCASGPSGSGYAAAHYDSYAEDYGYDPLFSDPYYEFADWPLFRVHSFRHEGFHNGFHFSGGSHFGGHHR